MKEILLAIAIMIAATILGGCSGTHRATVNAKFHGHPVVFEVTCQEVDGKDGMKEICWE